MARLFASEVISGDSLSKRILGVIERQFDRCVSFTVGVSVVGNIDEDLFDEHIQFQKRPHFAGTGLQKFPDHVLGDREICRQGLQGKRRAACCGLIRLLSVIGHNTVPFEI